MKGYSSMAKYLVAYVDADYQALGSPELLTAPKSKAA